MSFLMGVQISTDIDAIRNLQKVILIELFCNHSSVISERLFSGYIVTETKDHQLILEPLAEIPAREKWLFVDILPSLKEGDSYDIL